MMLRSRPAQKGQSCREQLMPEWSPEPRCASPGAVRGPRNAPFLSLLGSLVGFGEDMGDSGRSSLCCRILPGVGNHFVRSPRSASGDGRHKRWWDCDRVGLGLIDSLSDGAKPCGYFLGSSQTRITVASPRTRLDLLLAEGSATSPRSLPKNYVISSYARVESPYTPLGSTQMVPREIGKIQPFPSNTVAAKFRAFSGSLPVTRGFMSSLLAGDIEQSEDYTCIIYHGPNPRTTHMFGDCILERDTGDVFDFGGNEHEEQLSGSFWVVNRSEYAMPPPADDDFLTVCFLCKKKLDGMDIYMYRGEKAFCSSTCRSQAILVQGEEKEPAMEDSPGPTRASCFEEVFLPGVVVAT